jgi:acetyl-CoA carboxylase carboxyl transferase subunit beta
VFALGVDIIYRDNSERIESLIDSNTWRPLYETVSPCDPLTFKDQKSYPERLEEAQQRTGLQDAVQGTGLIDGIPVALGLWTFISWEGSIQLLGKNYCLIEYAKGLTVILICASGGARMQEGILSLMAKISAALHVHQSCAKFVYFSINITYNRR